jgi:hypothetical protein
MPSIDTLLLTDAQTATVERALEAIQPVDRDAFWHALTHRLRGEEIGDGSLARAIRDLVGTGAYRFLHAVAVGRTQARRYERRQAKGASA